METKRPATNVSVFTILPTAVTRVSDAKDHFGGAIDRVKYVDHAIMAMRADCAIKLMPYTTEHDTTCWRLNSEAFCQRCWQLRPWGTLRLNQLK